MPRGLLLCALNVCVAGASIDLVVFSLLIYEALALSEATFTLEELAEESGFDKRVIRSFIENGLLLGPDSRGRYARYGPGHLTRLKAIRNLRERQSLSFNEVRQALMGMSDEDIRTLAEPPVSPRFRGNRRSSVIDYLDGVRAGLSGQTRDYVACTADDDDDQSGTLRGAPPREQDATLAGTSRKVEPEHGGEDEPPPEARNVSGSPVDRLLTALSSLTGSSGGKGQSRSEVLHRFSVTPDIEISIRNLSDASQIERWGRICDSLREILLGGGQ